METYKPVVVKRLEMYARIKKHGEDIKKIFSLPADTDPIKLCKKLRQYELKAQKIQDIHAAGQYEKAAREESLLFVGLMLFLKQTSGNEFGIFLNMDQRGYALKISDDIVREKNLRFMHKDAGGFGIIAPDLNEN